VGSDCLFTCWNSWFRLPVLHKFALRSKPKKDTVGQLVSRLNTKQQISQCNIVTTRYLQQIENTVAYDLITSCTGNPRTYWVVFESQCATFSASLDCCFTKDATIDSGTTKRIIHFLAMVGRRDLSLGTLSLRHSRTSA